MKFLVAFLFVIGMTHALTQLPFDGSFKIGQFADIHYANGALSLCRDILPEQRPCSDLNTTEFIGEVLDDEKVQLAVFTGDNVSGALRAANAITEYSRPAYSRNIPWAMVFGNHDEEADLNRQQMMDVTVSLPFSISEPGPEDVFGVGNYVVQLLDSTGKNIFNLYFLDSGDYSKHSEIRGYEWIRPSQINWFLSTSRELKERNGGKIVPAIMFFHIPIPEYDDVKEYLGDKQEGVFHANVNSGLLAAILEAGDVKATFVGHDHVNSYCGKEKGIFLCYGGGVGYTTYGKAGWARRATLINLTATNNNSKVKVETWKRLHDRDLPLVDRQVLFEVDV